MEALGSGLCDRACGRANGCLARHCRYCPGGGRLDRLCARLPSGVRLVGSLDRPLPRGAGRHQYRRLRLLMQWTRPVTRRCDSDGWSHSGTERALNQIGARMNRWAPGRCYRIVVIVRGGYRPRAIELSPIPNLSSYRPAGWASDDFAARLMRTALRALPVRVSGALRFSVRPTACRATALTRSSYRVDQTGLPQEPVVRPWVAEDIEAIPGAPFHGCGRRADRIRLMAQGRHLGGVFFARLVPDDAAVTA